MNGTMSSVNSMVVKAETIIRRQRRVRGGTEGGEVESRSVVD